MKKYLLAVLALLLTAVFANADTARVPVRAGEMLPVGNGQTAQLNKFSGFTGEGLPDLNTAGYLAFHVSLIAPPNAINNRGIWRAAPDGTKELVVRQGNVSPGIDATFISITQSPKINEAGDIFFVAIISGPGTGNVNVSSLWAWHNGALELLVREGEQAPGVIPAATIGTISEIEWAKSAQVSTVHFKSLLVGAGIFFPNNKAYWSRQIGQNSLRLLAQGGTAVPGLPSTILSTDIYRSTNPNSNAILYASLSGPDVVRGTISGGVVSNDQALWLPGNTALRAGSPAPGTNFLFCSIFSTGPARQPMINARGHIAIGGTLCDANGVSQGSGIWTNISGTLLPIAKAGDPVPGAGPGVFLGSVLGPAADHGFYLGDDESIVIFATLTGPAVDPFNSYAAILRYTPERGLQLVVRGNQTLDSLPNGVRINNNSVGNVAMVNRYGDIFFVATLSGDGVSNTNDVAWFSSINNAPLRMVAREGDLIPRSGGYRLASIAESAGMLMNDIGQVLIWTPVDDASGGNSGWLRIDEFGQVRVWILSGTPLLAADNTGLNILPISAGRPFTFGSSGEFACRSTIAPAAPGTGDASIVLKITPDSCPADFNRDGQFGIQDLFDFLNAWFYGTAHSASDPRADFNNDGQTTVQDLFDFLNAWFGGCP